MKSYFNVTQQGGGGHKIYPRQAKFQLSSGGRGRKRSYKKTGKVEKVSIFIKYAGDHRFMAV